MQQIIEKANQFEFGEIPFTTEDFEKLALGYTEIQNLIADYASSYSRKQLAEKINEKIADYQHVLELIKQNLMGMTFDGEDIERDVTDPLLAMRLLVRLANIGCDKYELKVFQAKEYNDMKRNSPSNIWVIGEKEVLDKLSSQPFYGSDFSKVATQLACAGHPLIIATDHHYRTNVIPHSYYNNRICTSEPVSDISYFICGNAQVKKAITAFKNWTSENGADIKGLDEDTLFELMKNC